MRHDRRVTTLVEARATSCGTGLQTRGDLTVHNNGELVIGDDVIISGTPASTHLVNAAHARLSVGNRVSIGHGVAISCHERVVIEDDVSLGAFVAIMDSDFHAVGSSAPPPPRPVTIERGARIGARVIVLPGSRIGAGATVVAGSVVSGAIGTGAHVSGNPAMPHVTGGGDRAGARDAMSLVQSVFRLDEVPRDDDGPHSIPGWDSLGALELLVELEAVLGRTLAEPEIARLQTVQDVARLMSDPSAEAPGRLLESPSAIVARVFGLDTEPDSNVRPEEIPGWDSLGTLELVLALESTFGVSIDERRLADVRCVGDLEHLVR